MLIAIEYIIALAVIVILLLSAVRLHLSFGLHHGRKAKVKVADPRIMRTHHWHVSHLHARNLHDRMFRSY